MQTYKWEGLVGGQHTFLVGAQLGKYVHAHCVQSELALVIVDVSAYHMTPGELTKENSYWYQVHWPGAMSAKMLSPR